MTDLRVGLFYYERSGNVVQKKLPPINSAHGSNTRNIINELINLFNSMGYTYDEALKKAHDVLSEAKKINVINKNVQEQVNAFINEFETVGETNFETVQARGGHDVLNSRLNFQESKIENIAVQVPPPNGSDDTQNIQQSIDHLKSVGGNELIFVKGEYLSDPLILKQMKDFKITGNGSTIKRISGIEVNQSNLFEFLDSSDILVEGITVHGDNERFGVVEKQVHNIGFYGCRNVTLINVQSVYSRCDGIYINAATGTRHGINFSGYVDSENITMINVETKYSGRQGMSIISVDGFHAINSTYHYSGRSSAGGIAPIAGVDLESNALAPWNPKRVKFDNCNFQENDGGGLLITSSNDYTIVNNCKIKNNTKFGLYSAGRNVICDNVEFDSNGSEDENAPSIQVENSSRDGALSSITLNNIVIKNASFGCILIHEGVRFLGNNINISDSLNYGFRLIQGSATGVYDWSMVSIKNSSIKRVYKDQRTQYQAYFSLMGNFKAPVFIDNLIIDHTGLNADLPEVTVGFQTPQNTHLLKDLKIKGNLVTPVSNVRDWTRKTENNLLNGNLEHTMNYSSGNIADRPKRAEKGRIYFDTKLNKPIICTEEARLNSDLSIISPAVWSDFLGETV